MKSKRVTSGGRAGRAAMLLTSTNRLMQGLSLEELLQSGLRLPQAGFLVFLLQVDSLNMGALSRVSNVTTSVATRFVERLEAKGVVRRIPDEHDRRVVKVVLSEEGRRTAENLLDAYTRNIEQLLEGMDERDVEAFLRVLEQMNRRFAERLDLGAVGEAQPTDRKTESKERKDK